MNKLSFPVLIFGALGQVYALDGLTRLTETDERIIQSGLFDGMLIVDTGGTVHLVRGVLNKSPRGFWLDRLLRRTVTVQLDIADETQRLSVDEVKERVVKALGANPCEDPEDAAQLTSRICSASSIQALAQILSEAGFS